MSGDSLLIWSKHSILVHNFIHLIVTIKSPMVKTNSLSFYLKVFRVAIVFAVDKSNDV